MSDVAVWTAAGIFVAGYTMFHVWFQARVERWDWERHKED